MTARLHLPIRSNQPLSQSCPTVCGVSSLCQWTVLLPHDYRCDLSHLCPSVRQLSAFLIQTIIAWFSNVLKCKRRGLVAMNIFVVFSAQAWWSHSRGSVITELKHLIKPWIRPICYWLLSLKALEILTCKQRRGIWASNYSGWAVEMRNIVKYNIFDTKA